MYYFVQANEVERLATWYNPQSLADQTIDGLQSVVEWRQAALGAQNEERLMRDSTRLAWLVSPALAVHIPARFKYSKAAQVELKRLIRQQPHLVSHVPQALRFLVGDGDGDDTWLGTDAPEVVNLHT